MRYLIDKTKINWYSLILVTTIFLPFFYVKSVPFLIFLLLLFWILKNKSFKDSGTKFKFYFPYLFYALIFLVIFLLQDHSNSALKILERQTSFIILPFLILFKDWSKLELISFKKYYINTTLCIAVFSIIALLYFYFTNVDFVNTMDETYLQWKLPHLLGFHPTYFGLAIVVANILNLTSLEKEQNIFKKKAFYTSIFLTIYLIYLSPRTAVFCQILVWSWLVLSKVFVKKLFKFNKYGYLTGISIFITVVIFCSKYVINKFSNSISDRRFILWKPALKAIKENHYIFGEGLGNGKVLINNYIQYNNLHQFEAPDLHNQYLMNYLDLGILGVFIILVILIFPLLFLKNKELILFLLVFSIAMLTESFLYVVKGVVFFLVLSCFFIINSSYKTQKLKKH